MGTDVMESDNWSIPCCDISDITAEELDNMFMSLENGTELTLEWTCGLRRPPTPTKLVSENKEEKKEIEARTKDYDFMDELSQTPQQMRVRSTNSTPKGSAKKKTTSLAGVLDVMIKHGRLSTAPGSSVSTAQQKSSGDSSGGGPQ